MNPIADIRRRLDSIIRPGTVYAVDHTKARCRVKSGELLSDWLPYLARRAGNVREWEPVTTGEQCIIISPSGELAAGFVLLGLFSEAFPAPSASSTAHVTQYADGALISYDQATHALVVTLPANGTASLNAPGGVSIVGNISVTGTVTVSADVVAAGISLVNHKTTGVTGGNDLSGPPQ